LSDRFEEILLEKGVITPDQLHIALIEQQKHDEFLSEILINLRFASPAIVGELVSQISGYKHIDLQTIQPDINLISKLGKEFCERYQIIPFCLDDSLHVAMLDPENVIIQDIVKRNTKDFFKKEPQWIFYHTYKQSLLHTLQQSTQSFVQTPDASFENLFLNLLDEAFSREASDIHFMPLEQMVLVKFRIHGELETYQHFEQSIFDKTSVRFKVLSKLDIAERRRPQSGGCILTVHGNQVDCRVSFHPCLWGESLVVRLLPTNRETLTLEKLGFTKNQVKILQDLVKKPSGLFLVCGPTGSGKTTTLHALLQLCDYNHKNIMTLEQPIEYRVKGIRQTEIHENGIVSFADGVRSMLRHDPDIMLIGEIRDEDTAKMALRASMTGHLVLATLHASCPFVTPARLIDLGITPNLLSGQILAVLSQKLVCVPEGRKACGDLVVFTDDMHQLIGDGGNSTKLRKMYSESSSENKLKK
jgi:type II secretory ATPase GspE/PulE/Tfp pilus assembly ATPase PilB-like protein